MTADQAPPPLKSTGETPAELVRALKELGRTDARDVARLARVGARLEAAALSSSASSGWLQGVAGSKAGIIGLALGLGAIGAIGYSLLDREQVQSAEPQAPMPPPSTPVAVPAPALPIERSARRETAVEEATAASSVSADRTEQQATRNRIRPPRSAGEPHVTKRVGSDMDAPASSQRVEPQETSSGERELQANVDEPAAPAEERARPLSEPALVYKARSVAEGEPEAALRLLHEHAQRFPSGTLAPEREVLFIEVLRRLGRDAEAARRLQAFEARYPGSIHLRRLAP
jgi:hypothetical protein